MRLTMLGTGNALVTRCYNTCFALSEGERHLLVDGGGGNGLLVQLRRANIDWRDLREIFVTHKHTDHLLGVVWMVRMICQHMAQGGYEGEAYIYSHAEVTGLLRQMAADLLTPKQAACIDTRLHLVTVADGEMGELMGRKITFFDIGSTKADQFGFRMELDGGRSLVCCGDEPYNERERPYAQGATWLMHEAFCLDGEADIFHPHEKHHSTVKTACELAEALGVENLILYHTEDANLERREELYRTEGEHYYHGGLHIPNDLDVIEL